MTDYNETEPSKYSSIIDCTITISNMVLYFKPTVAILEQNKEGKETEENTFINEFIYKLIEYNIPKVIFEDIDIEGRLDLHINFLAVAFLDTCDDILKFIFIGVDKEMKYLIIISDPSNNNCYETLQEIAEFVGKYDITFIIQDLLSGKNNMFTVFPQIDENTCEETVEKPTHINTCYKGVLQSKKVFPIKNPLNLNKCPFRVGMATLYPFSRIKNTELLKTYDHIEEVKGSDLEIMKIVAEYFNATLDLYYVYRNEENPYVDKEFLNFILNASLDACAGGLYRIYGNVFEYSGPYTSQSVVWMYYAERADRSWENLMRKMKGLYVFVIFYICFSFTWYLTCLFDGDAVSLKNTLLYSWGALVGANSLQDARSLKQKILHLMYLIMCIFLSAYIGMHLYSFLTIWGPPQMFKTNDEVMNSGRLLYLKMSSKYFINDEKYVKFANTSEDCVSFLDCAEKVLSHNGLTAILEGNFYEFQAATAVNDEARVLRVTESILTVYNEMLIRKNNSLAVKFQKVVQSLFEAGITTRLFTEAVGITVVARADSANANMITNSYSCQAGCAITLMQFVRVFYIWILGFVLSCFVFIIEVSIKRERKPITLQ